MQLSEQGIQLIAKFEGIRLSLYNDPTGNASIAIGHLVHLGPINGSEPQAFKDGITTQQAYDLLKSDAQKAADCVSAHVTVPLSQAQTDALISFVYNIGCGAFMSSDLLTMLNQGKYSEVPVQLMRWVHGNGVVLPGLVARRTAEGVLFASQQQQGGTLLTTILKNFPILNQRITIRSDGTRDIGADYDCVPECIAMALQYFTGKAFHGGILKEAAYGYNYVGGTTATAYVGYCAHFGVKLYPIDASAPTLIQDIHQAIQNNHPAIITEPDRYSSTPGWTHCIIMHEEGSGYLVAADPFIAADITHTDAEWEKDLAVQEIWVLAPMKETQMGITLAVPGISQYFKAGTGNEWLCTNGFKIHGAILTYYMTAFNLPLGGLTGLGLPTSDEVSMGDTAHPERVIQHFEYGSVQYNPQHVGGAQPGAGPVYSIRPEVPVVAPPADVATLQAEIVALQAKLDAVRKDVA